MRRILYTLRDVVIPVQGSPPLGPIQWSVPLGCRVGVSFPSPAHWAALTDLLTGRIRPQSGTLEEIGQVLVQTDGNLKESLDLNRSIADYLHSADAPEFVWLENRRRVLWVLVDRLGILPSMTRKPLKLETPAVRDKFWALRFMLSRAQLLIGNEIFQLADDRIRESLGMRWADFPGALIAAEGPRGPPGALTGRVRMESDGRFVLAAPEAPETAREEKSRTGPHST